MFYMVMYKYLQINIKYKLQKKTFVIFTVIVLFYVLVKPDGQMSLNCLC